MIRRLALSLMLLAPGLAAAQSRDCVASGLLTIDTVSYGTQRVPRDPRNPDSQSLTTLSVSIRNLTSSPVGFTASFSASGVQQNFIAGQRWTLAGNARMTLIVANMRKPGPPDATVRQSLRLSCS
jgi:hypothetical protein